jgi:hypothetical protein
MPCTMFVNVNAPYSQATCKDGVMPILDTLPIACATNRADFGNILYQSLS